MATTCPTRFAYWTWRRQRRVRKRLLAMVALAITFGFATFLRSSRVAGRDPNTRVALGAAGHRRRDLAHTRRKVTEAALFASMPATSPPRGLVELTGARTKLATDATTNSAPWTPAAPWYARQDTKARYPVCSPPDPANCDDSWYAPNTTAAVQAALWATQNPSNCNQARYLVLDSSWPSGLGSSLHIHMYMLALAISDDRILVPSDELTWFYAAPTLCKQASAFELNAIDEIDSARDDQHSNHSQARKNYLDCFFVPTTRCPLPADWRTRATKMTAMNAADQVVRLPASSGFAFTNISAFALGVVSANPVLAAHRDKPAVWWKAQLSKFVLRPSQYTLRHLVWPLQQTTFYESDGALPHPLAAIFIRAGDKFKEAKPMSVDSHFAELAPVAARLGIKDVYVGSDSHDCIAEAVSKYGATYNIHFIDWHRPSGGMAYEDVLDSQNSWRMVQLVRLALADLFITAQADVLVGTLSSNWAEISDELRRANGKGRIPYLSPETPRHSTRKDA